MSPDPSAQLRVLIAGAGVAGLEALLALRELAGDAVAFSIKQGGLAAQQADAAAESIAACAGADVDPRPFHPVLRGVLLTGRGSQWIRRDVASDDTEGEAQRHALWGPPTKVAGRYLAPYRASLEGAGYTDTERPEGQLVEFTMEGHGR